MNFAKLMEQAKLAGIDPIEIYEHTSEQETIKVFAQKVDALTIAQSGGIAARGIYKGKMGYCFMEEDSDENIPLMIKMIKENAEAVEVEDASKIFAGSKCYPTIESDPNQLRDTEMNQKIALLKEVEGKLAVSDPRIVQVMTSVMQSVNVRTGIHNSLGLNLNKNESYSFLYSMALAHENGDNKSGMDFKVMRSLNDLNVDEFVEKIRNEVTGKLNAKQVKTGQYKVILKNSAMSDLLGALTGLFNGELVHKGISKLSGKLDSQIFDEKITILDDPLKKNGLNSTPFDDEGVASFTKTVVDHGVLKMFLHNQKSAAMMDTVSTGNGFKAGYAGQISISPTNFFIVPSETSFDELCSIMGDGLIIDELNGLHAGLNDITTDFSLQAAGYVVENGKIVRPVNLITVAGNFLEMMQEVEAVGNDLEDQLSSASAPSVLFKALSISGE
ncbi:MAG: TldD/PmbA family protein [Erysipelotrichaceae bacterium]|nr:TldD/PmbA family protein [Erysipelotrichaceae bacterium]